MNNIRRLIRAKLLEGSKKKKLDEHYANTTQDIQDALDHAYDFDYPQDIESYNVERIESMPLSDVLSYDDYSGWGEWESGELKDLSPEELTQELSGFRGERWANMVKLNDWVVNQIGYQPL